MKKICILPALMLFVLTAQAQGVIKGDANNDKTVSLLDVIETSNAILGKASANYNAANADVNGDKKVNAADIVSILNIIIANKQSAPAKADLIGTWEVKALDESSETFSVTFTDSKFSKTQGSEVQYEVSYTYENGTLTYTVPPSPWGDEAYTETKSVSLLCDKSALVMKYKPEEWETDEGLEEAEVYINKVKQPDTSGANLAGKWFCYHSASKSEVRSGLIINGNTAEFIIGAWATRMVGTYTYSNGILTLKPTAYFTGRGEGEWGYGRINPATLECSQWDPIENPNFPETFLFILNGNEAYSWYANLPCLYYKQ